MSTVLLLALAGALLLELLQATADMATAAMAAITEVRLNCLPFASGPAL
jgi:hypothetical protein